MILQFDFNVIILVLNNMLIGSLSNDVVYTSIMELFKILSLSKYSVNMITILRLTTSFFV